MSPFTQKLRVLRALLVIGSNKYGQIPRASPLIRLYCFVEALSQPRAFANDRSLLLPVLTQSTAGSFSNTNGCELYGRTKPLGLRRL